MVEQWTHKPLDVGSNPTLATLCLIKSYWMRSLRSQISPSPPSINQKLLDAFPAVTNLTLATFLLTKSNWTWVYR